MKNKKPFKIDEVKIVVHYCGMWGRTNVKKNFHEVPPGIINLKEYKLSLIERYNKNKQRILKMEVV